MNVLTRFLCCVALILSWVGHASAQTGSAAPLQVFGGGGSGGGGSGCALTGCTFNAGATVAFAAGSATTVNTASAQAAAGYFLPFATDAGITVGSSVTGTGIAANTYAIMVSGQTTTISITMPITTAAGNDNYAVSSTTGIALNMAAVDTSAPTALDQTAVVAAIWGAASTTANLTTPTASGTTNVITVASGGTSCLKGQIVYDSTTPSSLVYPATYVTNSTATTVTLNRNIGGTILGTDTVTCYPQIQLTTNSNQNGVTAADGLTFYPAVGLNQLTSAGVGSGTAITFTPPTSSLTSGSLATTGTLGMGWGGAAMNGTTFAKFTNGLSYVNLPGGDTFVGLGAGATLSATDSLTTAVGYKCFNALQVNTSEGSCFGSGAGQRSIDGNHLDLYGINALTSCTWGCNSVLAIATDAARDAQRLTTAVCLGSATCLGLADSVNIVAIGQGGVLGGTTSAYTAVNSTFTGASAGSSASIVSVTNTNAYGAFAFENVTTISGSNCFGFQCGLAATTGIMNAFGNQACASATTVTCTGFGNLALTHATGTNNVGLGPNAGDKITSGTNNLCLGVQVCHSTLTTGNRNIVIATSSNGDTASNNTSDTFSIFDSTSTPAMLITGMGTATTQVVTLHGSTMAFPDIASVTTATTGSLCWTATTISYDGTNTCLVSSARFKHDVQPLTGALSEIDRMRPVSFVYNGDKTDALHFGMIAEEVAKIDPRLVANDNEGRPLQIKYLDAISLLVQGMKEMQGEIDALKRHPLLAK